MKTVGMRRFHFSIIRALSTGSSSYDAASAGAFFACASPFYGVFAFCRWACNPPLGFWCYEVEFEA